MDEQQIQIGNLSVNYKTFGTGKPVLILHGWGGSSDSWVRVSENLEDSGFRAICPDMPGFGKTPEPPRTWTIADYDNFLVEFADKAGLDNFLLVGHSFGGGLSLEFAAAHPQMVRMLVLCDAAIIRGERLGFRQKAAKAAAGAKSLLLAVPIIGGILYKAGRKIIYRVAGVSDYYQASGVMRETFKNILAEDLTKYASKIGVPVLIVWGKKDNSTPVEDAYTLQHLIVGSKIEIIEETGHNPHRTDPERLARSISDFFKSK